MNESETEKNEQGDKFRKGEQGLSFPLIKTKIQIPYRRPELLKRSKLHNWLHANMDRKLIIVSAPAGYGKTSLLVDFAAETELPVCWFTIDQFDRDIKVFIHYLIASIKRRFPKFGTQSESILKEIKDPASDIYPIVSTLVNEIIESIPEYFVIVLDDHHTIENDEHVSEFLDLFISYLDENCHIILASRSLPALPNMALLIARKQAAGISIDELRFSVQEIQELAKKAYGNEISVQHAQQLMHITGGWIAGLQLTDPELWEKAPALTSSTKLTPSIYDFLLVQVLNQQPHELQQFLLKSSVLEEVNPEICSRILDIENPLKFIDQIRIRNLFITEYRGEIETFRYHDFFRDFLQTTLKRQNEHDFRNLITQAAEYYAVVGEYDRAINRYQALGEHKSSADIIVTISQPMFDTGRWDTLAEWIDTLPDRYLNREPDLLIFRAKIYAERGEYTSALIFFTRAERAATELGDKSKSAQALAMKGYILRYQGHYAEAISQCQQAFALVSGETPDEKFAIALAHKNIGLSLIRLGQSQEGRQALNRALYIYEELVNPHDIGMIHHDLGLSLELTGDLEGAVTHYKAALEKWEQLENLSPWANTLNGLGVIYLQRGEYELAEASLKEALQKTRQVKDHRIEAYTLASLGDLFREIGNYDESFNSFEQALDIAHRSQIGFVVTYALWGLGNINILTGNIQQAECRLLEALEHAQNHESAFEVGLCKTSLAILANQEGDIIRASGLLDEVIDNLGHGNFKQLLSRTYLHRAFTYFIDDAFDEAIDCLEICLGLTDQIGYSHYLTIDALQIDPLIKYALSNNIQKTILTEMMDRTEIHRIISKQVSDPQPPIRLEPSLLISGFSSPEVIFEGKKVQWSVAKSRDLFFYLLQHPKGRSKEQIGAIFWPEHGPERLDAAFRSTLYRLRRVVFRESVIFEDGLYSFNWRSDYRYDVLLFEEKLVKALQEKNRDRYIVLLEDALTLYKGEYLQGVYHDWAEVERTRLRASQQGAITNLAYAYTDQGKYYNAIDLYQKLLSLDPFNENAYREIMRCYYRLGDRAAAIRQYQTCVDMLREELALSPSEETLKLYKEIIS